MENAGVPTTNPFASARIRPGAISFLFEPDESAATFVDRLQARGWRGQIVGPHGTGKSTLLETLLPLIAAQGCRIERVRLPGRELHASPPPEVGEARRLAVYVIDGFEQFGAIHRLVWRAYCWWRGCGLLVTAHRDLGLPTLTATTVDDGLAQRVVDELLHGDTSVITAGDVTQALRTHPGNLRDALFSLYDIYELRRVANVQHQVSDH